jgi:heat shock protein HslJ
VTTRFGGTLQALAVLLASGVAGSVGLPATASPVDWRAGGHEPSWSLSRSGRDMTLETDFGASRVSFAVPTPTMVNDRTVRYVTSIGSEPLEVTVTTDVCIDTMTGMPRPEQVSITLGAKRFMGCGGDPASLLQGRDWTVVSLAGTPALTEPRSTMTFAADGRLSGLAACNRFNAAYSLTGEGLSIGKGLRTACHETGATFS